MQTLKQLITSLCNQRKNLIRLGYSKIEDEADLILRMDNMLLELHKYEYEAGWLHVAKKYYPTLIQIIPSNDGCRNQLKKLHDSMNLAKSKISEIKNTKEIREIEFNPFRK